MYYCVKKNQNVIFTYVVQDWRQQSLDVNAITKKVNNT